MTPQPAPGRGGVCTGLGTATERPDRAFIMVPLWGSVYTWALLKHLVNTGQATFTYRSMYEYLKVDPQRVQDAILRAERHGIVHYDKARRIYVADLDRARLYLPFLPKDIVRLRLRLSELPVEFSQAYEYFTAWVLLSDASTTPADRARKHGRLPVQGHEEAQRRAEVTSAQEEEEVRHGRALRADCAGRRL